MTSTHPDISNLFLAFMVDHGFDPGETRAHEEVIAAFTAFKPDFKIYQFQAWATRMNRAAAEAGRGGRINRLGHVHITDDAERMAFIWEQVEARR